jgi:hypothetical protein
MGRAEAPAELEDLPSDQFFRRQDLEQSFWKPVLGDLLERGEPDFNAFPDRHPLRQVGNDDLRSKIGRDVGKFLILSEKQQRLRGEPLAQDVVADAALSERNEVLHFLPGAAQLARKSEREGLVKQELHGSLTAGGWCAATWAA